MKDKYQKILGEQVFVACQNLPDSIRNAFDRPWHYVGDVKPDFRSSFINCICRKCTDSASLDRIATVISLERFKFVTDDMLVIDVYFGVCSDCNSVYWAKSGPPFARAMSLVTV